SRSFASKAVPPANLLVLAWRSVTLPLLFAQLSQRLFQSVHGFLTGILVILSGQRFPQRLHRRIELPFNPGGLGVCSSGRSFGSPRGRPQIYFRKQLRGSDMLRILPLRCVTFRAL